MEERKDRLWNPYVSGALAGVLSVASVAFAGKYLGASTTFVRAAGYVEKAFGPERVAQMAYFMKEAPKIDYGMAEDLQGGDSFLLCSDGLWGYFSDAELGQVLARHSARESCDILITQARQRAGGEGDNVSVAILKLVEIDVPAKPPAPAKR